MDHIQELALSEIQIADPWSSAKMGSLLQMLVRGSRPILGIRCNFKTSNAKHDAIAVVAGDVGTLVLDGDLAGPAFDVSKVVEIVASKLGPFTVRPPHLPKGLVVQHENAKYMWVEILSGGGAGFIRINDGEYFSSLPPDGQLNLAASVGVREIPKTR